MRDRIPFVGILGMEIGRNLFGETHVTGLGRQLSSVIREAPLHDTGLSSSMPALPGSILGKRSVLFTSVSISLSACSQ
jgi:hypothetical protein